MKNFQLRFIWVSLLLPINCFILIDGYVSDATSFVEYTESTGTDMETSADSLKQQNCGSIFTLPSGGIFHKPLETLSGNENCVWIVNARGARSYTVKIDSLGFPSEDRLLTITGFNHEVSNESVHYFPSTSGEAIQINNSTVLVITFKLQLPITVSSNRKISGFALQYKSFETYGVIEGGTGNETRCGDVMLGEKGFIIYKPFEKALEGERCAWTIAVRGALGYKINLQHMGFQPNERLITVAGFRKADLNVTYYVPTATGEVMLEDVHILVITFHSLQASTKGFALQYSALYTGREAMIDPRSRHVILGPETIYLKHPPGNHFAAYYQNNELSTFVFPPKNNIFTEAGEGKIVYKRNGATGLEGSIHSCYDSLTFRVFNATSNHWDFAARICGDVDTKLISGKDILLAVFDSDTSSSYQGFHMTYTN